MVFEGLQKHNFPKSPLGVRLVPESVENLFNRHHVFCLPVHRLPNNPVGALAQSFLDIETFRYVIVDLGHFIFPLGHVDRDQWLDFK